MARIDPHTGQVISWSYSTQGGRYQDSLGRTGRIVNGRIVLDPTSRNAVSYRNGKTYIRSSSHPTWIAARKDQMENPRRIGNVPEATAWGIMMEKRGF